MLKILIVTQNDPFYVPVFFEELFKRNISEKFNLVGIIIQKPLGKKNTRSLISQMYNFYGFNNFLALGIKFLIYKILNFTAINIFNGKFPGIFSIQHIIKKKNKYF